MKVRIRQTDKPDQALTLYRSTIGDVRFPADHQWWLAHAGDEIVGFCSAVWRPAHGYVFLSSSGVAPAFRGVGLQRRMIGVRLAWARRVYGAYAITYALRNNHPSIANLIRCGFRFWEPPESWAWVGEDVHYFRADWTEPRQPRRSRKPKA